MNQSISKFYLSFYVNFFSHTFYLLTTLTLYQIDKCLDSFKYITSSENTFKSGTNEIKLVDREETLLEKEKMLVTRILSFSTMFSEGFFLQGK